MEPKSNQRTAALGIICCLLVWVTGQLGAATTGVTVPSSTTLTNGYLPYAASGSQLAGNSPLFRLSSTAVGVNGNLVWNGTTNTLFDSYGSGTPEGVVTAHIGSLYRDGANGIIYRKASGSGNTGWSQLGDATGGGTNTVIGWQQVGVGTDFNYTLAVNTYEKIIFGTTGPGFVLTNVGSYQIIVKVAPVDNSTARQEFYLTNVTDGVFLASSGVAPVSSGTWGAVIPVQITSSNANTSIELWGQTANETYTSASVSATNTIVDVLYLLTTASGISSINGVMGAFSTGVGVTNSSATLSGNYTAGNNITLTTNAYGAVEISSGGSGLTNIYETTIITNLTVVSNLTVNATTIFNKPVTINTNVYITNGASLFIDGTNIAKINPTDNYMPVRTGTNTFMDSPLLVTTAGAVDLGSAGVRLANDGDGAITFLGLGDGSDEDLTINLDDTANTATITSSTGLNVANFSAIGLQQSGDPVVSRATTDTLTNKTLDAAGTGNTVKLTGYIQLIHPHRCDGSGAIIATNDYTQAYWGHALISGTAATNVNFIEYRLAVPDDIDTSVDLKVSRWKVRLSGADTAASTYTIGMASVADSASHDSPTLGQYVTMSVSADASGASGDVETVSAVTLTDWKSNVTAGQLWVIRVARDGAGDTSTVAHYDAGLVLQYGITQ